jgi:hypothetical protein
MYYRQFRTSSVLSGLLIISAGTFPAAAAEQLNLSAANCIPRHAGQFEGSGASGFEWAQNDIGAFVGAFLNSDDNDDQQLVCAIPFDPLLRVNGAIPSVQVDVDVADRHNREGVQATLFRQNGNVDAVEVDAEITSGPLFNIRRTLSLSVNPTAATKYLWIVVNVPDRDEGRSGVIGYTVRRP